MGFDVVADAYMAFMGRYSEPLAGLFLEAAEVERGQRALDVGCGPGALTARLADALGPDNVVAVDPSESFVGAARERCPGVDVRRGVAEELPLADGSVDVALAQLVVHFMADPVAGLREMGRVSRGLVAATVWDYGGGTGPLSEFWAAVQDLDPTAPGEGDRAGTRKGHLAELFQAAGMTHVDDGVLTVTVPYSTFEQWWHPYTLGVGPAGDHVAGLDADHRRALQDRCRERLPEPPFEIRASAWFARGKA